MSIGPHSLDSIGSAGYGEVIKQGRKTHRSLRLRVRFLEVKGSTDSDLSYKLFPNLNFFSFTQITFSYLRSENGDVLYNPVAFQSLRGRKNPSCTKNGSLVISAMPRIIESDVSPLPGSITG